jgi:hypothetical protein
MPSKETSGPDRDPSPTHIATSVHLAAILDKTGAPQVSVAWLIEQLGERSYGVALLLLAVLALVPGASTIVGVIVAWPAIQMILGHEAPVLPGPFARRKIAVDRLARAIRVVTPRLRWVETLIKPRWHAGSRATRRLTGFLMLLLGVTLISPLPFSHVIPALVIMFMALAYLEEDGIVLLVSFVAGLRSIAITAAALWGAVDTADWVGRLWAAGAPTFAVARVEPSRYKGSRDNWAARGSERPDRRPAMAVSTMGFAARSGEFKANRSFPAMALTTCAQVRNRS